MRALEIKAHRFIKDGVPETGTCRSPSIADPSRPARPQRGGTHRPSRLMWRHRGFHTSWGQGSPLPCVILERSEESRLPETCAEKRSSSKKPFVSGLEG